VLVLFNSIIGSELAQNFIPGKILVGVTVYIISFSNHDSIDPVIHG